MGTLAELRGEEYLVSCPAFPPLPSFVSTADNFGNQYERTPAKERREQHIQIRRSMDHLEKCGFASFNTLFNPDVIAALDQRDAGSKEKWKHVASMCANQYTKAITQQSK